MTTDYTDCTDKGPGTKFKCVSSEVAIAWSAKRLDDLIVGNHLILAL